MINAKTRRMLTVAVILTFGSPVRGQSLSESDRCREVKATWIDGVTGTTYTGESGTITQGGVLNGTTVVVYEPAFVYTPDPNFVAYISRLTITTNRGQLRAGVVYLYDVVKNDLWTAIGYIDPNSSTGKFAEATGVLYFNGKTLGTYPIVVYPSEITGHICFAKGSERQ